MVSTYRSLRLAVLIVGPLSITACDRQPATPPADKATQPTPTTPPPAATAPTAASAVSPAIAAAVANPARPAEDVAHDANRKPAETLAFFDVKPGEVVFEF